VKDYTHSTAPNRRYPDLLTQRLIKAALAGHPSPYGVDELTTLAAHCTQQEGAANKVERQVRKSAAALLVASRIGERFEALVTGASPKGTFVRVGSPPMKACSCAASRGSTSAIASTCSCRTSTSIPGSSISFAEPVCSSFHIRVSRRSRSLTKTTKQSDPHPFVCFVPSGFVMNEA
jgi:hypothetical protein